MAHIYKKVKKGRDYFYIRETQRVYGKPTTINQVYLGTADKVQALWGEEKSSGFSPKEFGSIFVLHELDRDLDLAGMVDGIMPPKKRVRGPSLGELIFYAAMNRAIAPTSKRQLASWYETTDIQRLRPLRLESLSSQNFWNHYDRIGERDLEKMVMAFFQKVHTLLPPLAEPLLLEALNLASAPRHPAFAAPDPEGPKQPLPLPSLQMGLALITGQVTGVPRYYQVFPGGLPGNRVLGGKVDRLLARLGKLGVNTQDLTFIFDEEIDPQALARIDAQAGFHFIAAAPGLTPEAARVPLKDFRPLPGPIQGEEDPVLHFETQESLGGRRRRLIITFDPRHFQKNYQHLRKKVQKVHRGLAALAERLTAGEAEDFSAAIYDHLAQLCQRLNLSPGLFRLSFPRQDQRPTLACQLDHQEVENTLRLLGKKVLVTDREDWPAPEIYRVYAQRLMLRTRGPNGNRASLDTRHSMALPLSPLYHWTDSKVRIHLFVSMVALTYLALLGQRLRAAGLEISPKEAMEEMRALQSAIYVTKPEGKLRRALSPVSDSQLAILQALGFQVQDGKVLPR
jgi:hypothetical protein